MIKKQKPEIVLMLMSWHRRSSIEYKINAVIIEALMKQISKSSSKKYRKKVHLFKLSSMDYDILNK